MIKNLFFTNKLTKSTITYSDQISVLIGLILLLFFSSCERNKNELPVDGDGNSYDTVVIGNQTWLKENLKTTSFIDGNPIFLVTDDSNWDNCQIGAYCWYDNNSDYKDVYGALYNYRAANSGIICPKGWHLPTEDEWNELIDYVGGSYDGSGKLKEIGTIHWKEGNEDATNETGFTALPAGTRFYTGPFMNIGTATGWWMSGINIGIGFANPDFPIGQSSVNVNTGLSVRCIKDK
jgi:uncharacterized protein (TIGR02145 family)